jgi:formylglycine-generating enzyme required for sulfatase activity
MNEALLWITSSMMLLGLATCSHNTVGFKTRVRKQDGMPQVYVPAGKFLMGAAFIDSLAQADEFPQHSVYLDAYWIDLHEVTNGQYALCVAAGVCKPPNYHSSYSRSEYYGNPEFDDYPVIDMSWFQASAYCQWVGAGLPTEAQWEKAARGTDGQIYPWGNHSAAANLLNFNSQVIDTTAVCSYSDGNSPYGLCDMSGNAWEWVNDWYGADYYPAGSAANPIGPETGYKRVLRSGSWHSPSADVRSSNREGVFPGVWFVNYGFRCAQSGS